jgi:hypothetical protein
MPILLGCRKSEVTNGGCRVRIVEVSFLMTTQMTVNFPEKRSLGSLYTAEEQFPHPRKWIGEARGKMELSFPTGRMLGVALGQFGWEALAETNSAELKCLRSIDFSTSQFCDKTARAISALGELAEMRLDFLKFGDDELLCLKEFPGLRTLWLTGTQVTDKGMSVVAQMPGLLNLVLKNTNVTDAGFERLAGSNLVSLTVPTQTTDAGLKALYALSKLQRLDLSYTKITNEGLASLAALKSLEELYLNDTAITDAGVAHLSALPSLKTLFLSGTKVSDAAIPHLENVATLEHLELRDTGVTEIAIARLRTKLPKCAVFGG